MAQKYAYRARNLKGKIVRGTVEADGRRAAVALLRQRDLFVVQIKPAVAFFSLKPGDLLKKRVGIRDLAVFSRQFATMIGAGVPIVQCLQILYRQAENKRLREAVRGVVEKLEAGQSLGEATKAYPRVFPSLFVSMLEAGEVSGNLDAVLERLAAHYEKEHEMKEKIKSAMTYPAVVMVMAVVAVFMLMIFVLPVFVDLYSDFQAGMPLPTRIVMGAGEVLRTYWYLAFLATGGAVCGFQKLRTTRRGKEMMDRLSLKFPIFGGLVWRVLLSRFCRTLSTLVSSGVPLLRSLEVVKNVVGNSLIAGALDKAASDIREGQSMVQPLRESGVFPPMVTRMVAVGEETGALDSLLEKLADLYDREIESIANRLSSLIEPILIAGMGGVVGFIIFSIMLPVFGIMSSIK